MRSDHRRTRSAAASRRDRYRWGALACSLLSSVLAACSDGAPSSSGDEHPMPIDGSIQTERASPRFELARGFVDETRCARCHPVESALWRSSDHDLAMQLLAPLPDAYDEPIVPPLAPFGGERLPIDTPALLATREGGSPILAPPADDAASKRWPALFAFGHRPLQQVLVPGERGRLQAFTAAWDVRPRSVGGQRWYSLHDADHHPAMDDPFHFAGPYQTWNVQCAECHSTDLRRGYDPETDRFDTRFARVDVGCQACHGAGAEHVAWAEGATASSATDGKGLVVRFFHGEETRPDRWRSDGHRASGAAYEVDACARCHARRHAVSPEDERGRPLLDDFEPETLRPGLYFPDGQIRDEVYVYGSFLQSRMYAKGVRCSDCHDPHSGRLAAEGDVLCTRCHSEAGDSRFPSLPRKTYDSADHHGHELASEGARCVACHMPSRVYMGVDARRDHRLAVPRPDLSESLDVPNPCAGCHGGHDAAWAAAAIDAWHGPDRSLPAHFATPFAAAEQDPARGEDLIAWIEDLRLPEIVRASAIDRLPTGVDLPGERRALEAAVGDPSGWIRSRAAARLRAWPPEAALPLAVPLLHDPRRAVRSEAAQVIAGVLEDRLEDDDRRAFEHALDEHAETQRTLSALPSACFNLALVAERRGQAPEAEAHYRRSLELDPGFLPAWANLAQLLARSRGAAAAEGLLRKAVVALPDAGELHYSLALALAEQGRTLDAIPAFERAARLLPDRARAAYNWGLALQQAGRTAEAREALELAFARDPNDPDIAYALAVLHARTGEAARALPYAEKLVELTDGAPGPSRLLDELRARVGPK